MSGARARQNQHPLNFAILLISAAAAAVVPLQTFLLAFAVLGPFHYLTQIAWLRKKQFYLGDSGLLKPAFFFWLSALLCAGACLDFWLRRGYTTYVVGIVLLLSLGALDVGASPGRAANQRRLVVLTGALLLMLLTHHFLRGYGLFLAAFVPTVMHVYVFTFLFLLSGLRSSRLSLLGSLNAALLLLVPIAFLFSGHAVLGTHPGPYWLRSETLFVPMHQYIAAMLGRGMHFEANGPLDATAVSLLRALAFIYLHHYLNWFGKTQLLEWHRVSRHNWTGIAVTYAASLAAYAYSFALGFYASFSLSLLHVLLEFPLDWRAAGSLLQPHRRTGITTSVQHPAQTSQPGMTP